MLISVKTAQPIWFFFHQKMRNWYWGNYKKRGRKIFTRLKSGAKNEKMGPSGPPLLSDPLCVAELGGPTDDKFDTCAHEWNWHINRPRIKNSLVLTNWTNIGIFMYSCVIFTLHGLWMWTFSHDSLHVLASVGWCTVYCKSPELSGNIV